MVSAGAAGPIKVAIVDDSELVATSLQRVLRGESDIDIVGTAGNAFDALELARDHALDVVVMDFQLGSDDGIETSARLMEHRPEARVVILTGGMPDRGMLMRARSAGCVGFVAKTSDIHGTLADIVRSAHVGTLRLDGGPTPTSPTL